MEERLPNKYDFDSGRLFRLVKGYSTEQSERELRSPLPVRITHFMQPFCMKYGVPTRDILFKLQEERPLNLFLDLREMVIPMGPVNEATGKSVVGGWSIGIDRDLKDDTFDLFGHIDETYEAGNEVICPFTKVQIYHSGEWHDVLRIVGADADNDFEWYELLLRTTLDELSNVQNSERLAELLAKHDSFVKGLMKKLRETGRE